MRNDHSPRALTSRHGEPADPTAQLAATIDPDACPARQRFLACRWHRPADLDLPAHCAHRDVRPMAGTGGFNPEAWCVDCSHYKGRRVARRQAACL